MRDAVAASYERWDGRGWPGDLGGDAIPVASRVAQLAEFTEVAQRVGGTQAAVALARGRAGQQFDPHLAVLLAAEADAIFGGLDAVGNFRAVIDAEPALAVIVSGECFDQALRAVANFIDLKSPYTLGHAGAVAEHAASAATGLGLADDEVRTVHRAGLVHDFGRLGASNAIGDKRGPLGAGEWERIRMFPYLTERMLRFSDALAPFGAIAVQHRERLDGSGYPRGLGGAAISRPARILGVADAYRRCASRGPTGRRCPATRWRRRCVPSQSKAASTARPPMPCWRPPAIACRAVQGPSGLTRREVEVLKLLALGLSNKDIAARLVISPKTVGSHVEPSTRRIDASSRATASLFAVQHGLLPDGEPLSATAG